MFLYRETSWKFCGLLESSVQEFWNPISGHIAINRFVLSNTLWYENHTVLFWEIGQNKLSV
uniref:Uncharacterized protein n=1 Tax=Anguilla anguilla TaxID=7936 RepID=A0A0E9WFW4_ANGAN